MTSEIIISILKDYAFGPAASSGEPLKLMLLYSSVAKNRFKAHSDVDIAVSADRPLSEDRLLETGAELSALLDRHVDVLDLFSTDGLILYKIMTGHIRIKIDAALYVKYYSKALGFREDFKPLQDMMREARIGRFIHGSRALHSENRGENAGSHILLDRDSPSPDSMAGVFIRLGKEEIIGQPLAGRLAKAVGFRNIAVHEYEQINWTIVYSIITKNLEDFRTFAATLSKL